MSPFTTFAALLPHILIQFQLIQLKQFSQVFNNLHRQYAIVTMTTLKSGNDFKYVEATCFDKLYYYHLANIGLNLSDFVTNYRTSLVH